jgi:hypothetical protein
MPKLCQIKCKKLFIAIYIPFLFILTLRSALGTESLAKSFTGVCPPFFIRDESGAVINPVSMQNTDKPYSPKQTCGLAECHNYDKITKGYHFQQGKDEQPSQKLKNLYQWVLSPGQYGGRW